MAGPSDVEETSGAAVSGLAVFLNPHTRLSLLGGSGSDCGHLNALDVPSPDFLCSDSKLSSKLLNLDLAPCTDLLIETVSGIIVFLMVN